MILTDGLCGTDNSTWSWLTDGRRRYAGNRSLKYFNASLPNLTDGTEMFKGCTALSAVEGDGSGTMTALSNATSMFEGSGVVAAEIIPIQGGNATAMYKNCKNLKLFFSDLIKDVICDSMFEGCSNLVKMRIGFDPGNVATITSAIKMFKDCTSLYIFQPFIAASGPPYTVEITGSSESMFEGCTELRSFPYTNAWVKGMTNCKNMFAGCAKLRAVYGETLANNGAQVGMVGTQITNAEGMFKGCIKLIEAPIIFGSIATADSMFEGCASLTAVGSAYSDYPTPAYNLVSANNMFAGCTSLTNVGLSYDSSSYGETCGDTGKLVKAKGMFGNAELGWCKLDFASALHIALSITNLVGKDSDGTEEWGKISIGLGPGLKDYKVPETGDPAQPETLKTFEELLLNGYTEYGDDQFTNLTGPGGTFTPIQKSNIPRGLLTKGWTVELHYDGDETSTIHPPTSAG